ncbi:MDR family MFS transporter [uncultured Cellulomonas sp.]|uniref:MDR family MFS transporter n=1 Tax=uncultured Cellulomonas sp. TaxID=189682 RepID=UPI002612335E|nr:MDR family MFS transporter [uncultured Cellulomonas sp.]
MTSRTDSDTGRSDVLRDVTELPDPAGHPPPAAPDRLSPGHRRVIGVLMVAAFTVILNETVMSVALPVLQDDLGVALSVGQWLTTAYMLTMAVVIPLTGFLIQRVPTRALFVLAMSVFSAGTLAAALAPSFAVLLGARIVQASGTAIMMPLLMTTVMTLVPAARRGLMMGNISIVISVAPALGPTLSGYVLGRFGWRGIFLVVLPIALTTLVVGARWLVTVAATTRARVDLLSVPLAALGFGGLVYGMASIGEAAEGEAAIPVGVLFAVGGLFLLLFLLRQIVLQRDDRALLDLRVFRSSIFSVSMGAMVLATATMFGAFILLPLFAQRGLGLDPLQAGLITLPGGLMMGLASPFVGRVYDARGPRVLLVPGAVLISGALWVLTTVSATTTAALLVGTNIALMVGLAATFTPLMTAGLGSLPPRLYSHGSAVLGSFQQVAAAAGTAVFITVVAVAATAAGGDTAGAEGTIAGVRTAFLAAAILSLTLFPAVLLVRRPASPTSTDVPAA